MQHSTFQPRFTPFYTILGLAAQASCTNAQELVLGEPKFANWPTLSEQMELYIQDYKSHTLHIFSGIFDEHRTIIEDWKSIFEYALDSNGEPFLTPDLTEQEATQAFLAYYDNNWTPSSSPDYFTWVDPDTQVEHLFIFFLI